MDRQPSQRSLETVRRVPANGTARHCGFGFFLLLLTGLAGCAMRYSDNRAGVEHLWGLGQFQLQVRPLRTNLISVATGTRITGLCLELGRETVGLSLGCLVRQKLVVVSTEAALHELRPDASQAIVLGGGREGVWALGHVRLITVPWPRHHHAIITGKALAGVGAQTGGGGSLTAGLDRRHRLEFADEHALLEVDQDMRLWPGFDLWTARVDFPAQNQPHLTKPGEP